MPEHFSYTLNLEDIDRVTLHECNDYIDECFADLVAWWNCAVAKAL